MSVATVIPYSALGSLMKKHETLLSASEGDRESAEAAAFSLASGLGVIGKLLLHCDARQIEPADWNILGDFLITSSEVMNSLLSISLDHEADKSRIRKAVRRATGGDQS